MDETTLSIGELAARAGVNASAIRYYERIGVLPVPSREGGRRRYTEHTVRRLEVIETAKEAGLSLADVRGLLASHPAHEELRRIAERRLPEVRTLIERAEEAERWLTLAEGCDCETLDACALFDGESRAA